MNPGMIELLRTNSGARLHALDSTDPEIRSLAHEIHAEMGLADGTLGAMPTGGPRDWSEALALVAKRDNISLSQAGRVCMKEFAHLHPVAARSNGSNGPPREAQNRRGTRPAGNGPAAAPATGGPSTWAEAVEHISRRDNVRPSEAGRRAMREYGHLHPIHARNSHRLAHA